MIDIKKAEQEFKNYTNKYDMNESHISRKVYHTFRVEELCEKIAILLGMNEEEINLAKLIGLLHDIGRFEQYTRYKTYDDPKSIDHADFGVNILKENNYIRKYIKTDKYDSIILKAVKNHNKYAIENNVNETEKIFCQIIRDADKLDIMYQATCEFWKDNIKEMEKQVISTKVLEQFLSKQVVNKKYINADIDRVVVVFAFIYDFNFKESYKLIKENNYTDKIVARFNFLKEETKKQIEEIRKISNDYINNNIEREKTIDIINAKKKYREYISRYNPNQPRIALKASHINRTAENAKWIATKLKLSEDDILLAELIGLLHDIGRFEQVKKYNTFIDKLSVNHAEYGVKVLFEDNLIRNFIEDDKYDEIIKKAILNHNKAEIENVTDERELLHCKIIRDADKLDIFYVILNDSLEATYPLDRYQKEPISPAVKEEFLKNHVINHSNIKTCVDLLVGQIAFVFNINYLYSLERINNEDYLEKIIKKFDSKDEQTINDLNELKNIAKEYIQEKIKEGEICLKNY